MKRTLLSTLLLIASTAGFAQVVDDNGPIIDPQYLNLRFSLNGGKWNKTNLTYYIYNTSDNLTAAQRTGIIQEAFQKWSSVSCLSFTQVSSPSLADIKFKWVKDDHGDYAPLGVTSETLAHAYPPPPLGGSLAGEIHFNDYFQLVASNPGLNQYLLLHTATHEIGHTLGIDHTDVPESIMYAYYTHQTELGSDDILAIHNLYGGASIAGSSTICGNSSATFTSSYPSGTYTWDKSSNLTLVSTSGNTATFTRNGTSCTDGWVAIKIGATEVARRNIYANNCVPVAANISASYGCDGNTGYNFGQISLNSRESSIDQYEWQSSGSGGPAISEHPAGFNTTPGDRVRISGVMSSIPLYVRAHNPCGWSEWKYLGYISQCNIYYSMSISPNPANSILTLDITPNAESAPIQAAAQSLNASGQSQSAPQIPLYEIKLYNSMGTLALQTTAPAGSISLDVSSLPSSLYILHVHDGSDNPPQTQNIIISH